MNGKSGGVSPKGVLYQTIDRESTSERVDQYLAKLAAEKAAAAHEQQHDSNANDTKAESD